MLRLLLSACVLWAAPVFAHEFWIDPQSFQVPAGTDMVADIRVGDRLSGAPYSYVPANFRRFDIVMDGVVTPVAGRIGDRPALDMAAPAEGLAVVVHVTRDYRLTYQDWAKFERFCTHKDFEWALARHVERGLPQTGFRERYVRHAKSLVAVGHGRGQDAVMGLEVEIVAGANPYADDLKQGFPVQVLYQGTPRAEAQVELFQRAPDGTVTVTLHRTDAQGRATLPVQPGHFYLVDHVVMREIDPKTPQDEVWESLWASLTFEVPQ